MVESKKIISATAPRLSGAPLRQWLKRRRQSSKSPQHVDAIGKNDGEIDPPATSTEPQDTVPHKENGQVNKSSTDNGMKGDALLVEKEPQSLEVDKKVESTVGSTTKTSQVPASIAKPVKEMNNELPSMSVDKERESAKPVARGRRTRAAASQKDDESISISTDDASLGTRRRTRRKPALEEAAVITEGWTCAHCTLVNKPRARTCAACEKKPISSTQSSDELSQTSKASKAKSSPSKKRKSAAISSEVDDTESVKNPQKKRKSVTTSPRKNAAIRKSTRGRKAAAKKTDNPQTKLTVDTSDKVPRGQDEKEKYLEAANNHETENSREQECDINEENCKETSTCFNCNILDSKFTNIKGELLIWQGQYEELKQAYKSMYSQFMESQKAAIAQFRQQQEDTISNFAELHECAVEGLRQKHESLLERHLPNPSALLVPFGVTSAVTPSPKGAPTNFTSSEKAFNFQKATESILEENSSLANENSSLIQSTESINDVELAESQALLSVHSDGSSQTHFENNKDNTFCEKKILTKSSPPKLAEYRELDRNPDLSSVSDTGSPPTVKPKLRAPSTRYICHSLLESDTSGSSTQDTATAPPDDSNGTPPSQIQNKDEDVSQALLGATQHTQKEETKFAFGENASRDQFAPHGMPKSDTLSNQNKPSTPETIEWKLDGNESKRQSDLSKPQESPEKGPPTSLFCTLIGSNHDSPSNSIPPSQDSRTTVGESTFVRTDNFSPDAGNNTESDIEGKLKHKTEETFETFNHDVTVKGAGPSWISNAPSRNFNQEMKNAVSRESIDTESDLRRSRRRSTAAMPPPNARAPSLWDDLSQQPNYKYQEVVRCKAIRQGLPCRECPDCQEFYDILRRSGDNLMNSQSTQQFSRHRSRFTPPSTPQDFWEMEFVDEKRKADLDGIKRTTL